MKIIKNIDNNLKPREKALKKGIEALQDEELIAVLINTGCKDSDVIELARILLLESGGISKLKNYTLEELKKIKGIGNAKAVLLKAAFELNKRVEKDKLMHIKTLLNEESTARFMKALIEDNDIEKVVVILLDKRRKIINYKIQSIGTNSSVLINQSDIASYALKNYATYVYIGHNHPSNIALPSKNDERTNMDLLLALGCVNVVLLDHLIITDYNYYSMNNKTKSNYDNENIY